MIKLLEDVIMENSFFDAMRFNEKLSSFRRWVRCNDEEKRSSDAMRFKAEQSASKAKIETLHTSRDLITFCPWNDVSTAFLVRFLSIKKFYRSCSDVPVCSPWSLTRVQLIFSLTCSNPCLSHVICTLSSCFKFLVSANAHCPCGRHVYNSIFFSYAVESRTSVCPGDPASDQVSACRKRTKSTMSTSRRACKRPDLCMSSLYDG